jgi:hypothetical protein
MDRHRPVSKQAISEVLRRLDNLGRLIRLLLHHTTIGNSNPGSRTIYLRQALAQDRGMMSLVADEDEGQRANADRGVVGGTAAQPCVVWQVLKEGDMRPSEICKLGHQLAQRNAIVMGSVRVEILVEARKRRSIAAGKPQRAIAENTFAIDQMSNDLFDCPGVRGMANACLAFRHVGEEGKGLRQLGSHGLEDIFLGHERNVFFVSGGVLG